MCHSDKRHRKEGLVGQDRQAAHTDLEASLPRTGYQRQTSGQTCPASTSLALEETVC